MSFVTHEVSDVELPIIYNTNLPHLVGQHGVKYRITKVSIGLPGHKFFLYSREREGL